MIAAADEEIAAADEDRGDDRRPQNAENSRFCRYHSAVERIRIVGGHRLVGEVAVSGAKNSVLKLMAAALLAPGRTTITQVPGILDVDIMAELLRRLGCGVESTSGQLVIDVPEVVGDEADYDLVRRLRASICVLGPLLARCGEAHVALPGGDNIGSRGLDLHVAGLQKLGAELESEHGFLIAKAPRGLTGANVWLDFPSVGATENLLMAGVLASGTTVIDNAAIESLAKSGPDGKVRVFADSGKAYDLKFSLKGFAAAHDDMVEQAKAKATKAPAAAPAAPAAPAPATP